MMDWILKINFIWHLDAHINVEWFMQTLSASSIQLFQSIGLRLNQSLPPNTVPHCSQQGGMFRLAQRVGIVLKKMP